MHQVYLSLALEQSQKLSHELFNLTSHLTAIFLLQTSQFRRVIRKHRCVDEMHCDVIFIKTLSCIADVSLDIEIRSEFKFVVLEVIVDDCADRDCHWEDLGSLFMLLVSTLDELQSVHDSAVCLFAVTHRLAFVRQLEAQLGTLVAQHDIGLVREFVATVPCIEVSLALLPFVKYLHIGLRQTS